MRPPVGVAAAVAAVALSAVGGSSSLAHAIEIHGSGTTNPSRCLWLIMEQFTERAKVPIRLTYRAVGSSTGQREFVGNVTVPANDFGAGDIPMPRDKWETLQNAGRSMLHLPFVMSATGFFHSVPGVPEDGPGGQEGIKLTPCILAKIFGRRIEYWDDDQILVLNPNLKEVLPRDNFPITVARRFRGSYLHEACPEEWASDLVGNFIQWPEGTVACEGSDGMANCLRDIPGAIGYIDASRGHDERGLREIMLQNRAGTFLTSLQASVQGGIGDAALSGSVPSSAEDDFSAVSFINQPGMYTWPLVGTSFAYARLDGTYVGAPEERSLLIAFLRSLYDPSFIGQCERFGFTPVPNAVRDMSLAGLARAEAGLPESAPRWTFEADTMPLEGQGDYVISTRRRSYAGNSRHSAEDALSDAAAAIAELREQVSALSSSLAEMSGERAGCGCPAAGAADDPAEPSPVESPSAAGAAPSDPCDLVCANGGMLEASQCRCWCPAGWTGPACETPLAFAPTARPIELGGDPASNGTAIESAGVLDGEEEVSYEPLSPSGVRRTSGMFVARVLVGIACVLPIFRPF